MQWPAVVGDQLNRIVAAQPITPDTDTRRLDALSATLATLGHDLRERMQAVTAAQVTPLIRLLEADGPVESPDLEFIRLWLVGDAEYYLEITNDYPARVAELNRLMTELRRLESGPVTPSTAARMGAVVQDALRVTSDIAFYRQQEERVRSIQTATLRLTWKDKVALARLLAQKLSSDLM
jgi:hypothetical protein